MSYKFTLDHTLAIETIHDMITIDIRPETRCSVTGSDVEIHGYLAFDGSYLTDELGEERFEGKIPLDITLPYLGGAPDVRPEIVSFDYMVKVEESLTLNLEISLKGYEAGVKNLDAHAGVMDAWIAPVTEERVIEEAKIEPFDVTLLAEQSVASSVETPTLIKEAAIDGERTTVEEVEERESSVVTKVEAEQIVDEEDSSDREASTVEEVEERESSVVTKVEAEQIVDEDHASNREPTTVEEVEERESSVVTKVEAGQLVDEEHASNREPTTVEEVKERESSVVTKVEAGQLVDEEGASDREPTTVEEVEERESSVVTKVEAGQLVDEEGASDREPITVEEVGSPIIANIEAESVVEQAIPYSPLVEIDTRDIKVEEIEFDPPMAEQSLVERVAEEGRKPKMSNTAAALMNELFEMKRGTAFKQQEDVIEVVDPITLSEEIYDENDENDRHVDVEQGEPVEIVDSVARQFADRASTIKMVYVRHESETLGELLTRYSVTLDDVWNLSELADGIDIGDCVMIKYEKPI